MSNKQFKSALRRLRNGIPIYRKRCPWPAEAVFTVEFSNGKYRGIIRAAGFEQDIIEVWETPTLDWLRRIAVGYYPSIAKAIGPARQFAGV